MNDKCVICGSDVTDLNTQVCSTCKARIASENRVDTMSERRQHKRNLKKTILGRRLKR